jgi:hypothetical protein
LRGFHVACCIVLRLCVLHYPLPRFFAPAI